MSLGAWVGLGLLVFVLISWLGSMSAPTPISRRTSSSSSSAPAVTPSPPREPTYDLALMSAKGYESDGGYHIIEGLVKNVSSAPLKNVTAVGIWSDKDGEFIKSDDAIIDYNPILPGQVSPFKTMSTGNPAMAKYRVEFKVLLGGTLRVDDQRKTRTTK